MDNLKRLTNQKEWTDDIDLKNEFGYKYIFQRLCEYENTELQPIQIVELQKENKVLKKQLEILKPKKVTHQETLAVSCTCPNCLNVIDKFESFGDNPKVRVLYLHCHFCGQALDWENCDNYEDKKYLEKEEQYE